MTQATALKEDIETIFKTEPLPTALAGKVRSALQDACGLDKRCDSGGSNWEEGAAAGRAHLNSEHNAVYSQ